MQIIETLDDGAIDELVAIMIEDLLQDPDLTDRERVLLLAERDAAFDADEPVSLRWAPGHEPDDVDALFV